MGAASAGASSGAAADTAADGIGTKVTCGEGEDPGVGTAEIPASEGVRSMVNTPGTMSKASAVR